MTKLKTAITESKLLSTDAKLLLAPNKRRHSLRNDHQGNGVGTRGSASSASAISLAHIPELKSRASLPKQLQMNPLTVTRSAPSSPTSSAHRKRGKDNKSDSETHDSRALSVTPFEDDLDSGHSSVSLASLDSLGCDDEEEVWRPSVQTEEKYETKIEDIPSVVSEVLGE